MCSFSQFDSLPLSCLNNSHLDTFYDNADTLTGSPNLVLRLDSEIKVCISSSLMEREVYNIF